MSDKREPLRQAILAKYPAAQLTDLGDALVLYIDKAQVVETMTFLRDDPACDFKLLIDVTAVHYPGRDPELDVVYQLLSVYKNHRLRIKVGAAMGVAVPSVVDVWPSANWFEREAYEMFGVLFSGHPDLRRLITEYDFEGYPLRKEFPVEGYYEVRYDEAQGRVVREPINLTRGNRLFYDRANQG